MKVLFTTNIPSPYRIQFFNELSKYCELTVVYERKNAKDRDIEWLNREKINFDVKFLKGIKVGNEMAFCPEIIKIIKKGHFDLIVVGGYSTPTGMVLINYLKRKKVKFILNSDGGIIKEDNIFKYKIKKYFISSASAWLSTGKETTKYLKHYGAKEEEIYVYPFTSINEKDILNEPITIEQKNKVKTELGISEEKVIISIGQFIHRKGFDILLKAIKNVSSQVGVYIIGGQPTDEYIELKENLQFLNVHFVGFKSKDELKKYYKIADVFVLPTREDIWGLVINEALAFGLPVITTDKCVAGLELIANGKNGYIIPVDDVEALSNKINNLANVSKEEREKYYINNIKKTKEYTIENMAQKHIEIFERLKEKLQ